MTLSSKTLSCTLDTMSTSTFPLNATDVDAIKRAAKLGLKTGNRSYLGVRFEDGKHTVQVGITVRQAEGADPPSVDFRSVFPALGSNEVYRSVASETAGKISSFWASADHGYTGPLQSVLGSLANLIRVGDELSVTFRIGNDTDRMKDAGFTRDDAYVTIVRATKLIATFHVGTTVGNGARYSGMVMS